jgi:hypothetical protein
VSQGQELKEGSCPGKESRLLGRRPERMRLDGHAGRDTVGGRVAAALRYAVSTGKAGIAIEHGAKADTAGPEAECGSPASWGAASRTSRARRANGGARSFSCESGAPWTGHRQRPAKEKTRWQSPAALACPAGTAAAWTTRWARSRPSNGSGNVLVAPMALENNTANVLGNAGTVYVSCDSPQPVIAHQMEITALQVETLDHQ